MTRSTAMKRTCRRSSPPSKVSWGCLRHPSGRAGLAPWYIGFLTPQGQPAPPASSRTPSSWKPVRWGAHPSTCLHATPDPSPLPSASPTSPIPPAAGQAGLRLAPVRCCPGPARSRGPSTQSALCSSPGLSPPRGSGSGAPVQNGRLCRHSGAGGRVSAH